MLERTLGRLTNFLLRHRVWVLLFWLLPLPVYFYGFTHVNEKLLTIVGTSDDAQTTFTFRAKADRFAKQSQFLAVITFHHSHKTVDDKAFKATAATVHRKLRPLECVKTLTAFHDRPFLQQFAQYRSFFVAKHGRTLLSFAAFRVRHNGFHQAARCVNRVRHAIEKTRPTWALRDMEVLVTGPPAIDLDIGRLTRRDSQRAELIVGIVALFLLVWMFRSASAAVLPVITAMLAVWVTLTVVHAFADKLELSMYVAVIASMAGLGLGLDYALLYVTRYREEREQGREVAAAIATASKTAGRAILGSGCIVMIGFAGLLIPDLLFPRSVGLAGMLVVFFTMAVTLTLLPVLVSYWAPTMTWPRWRWFAASHQAVDRFWSRWSDGVLKRPRLLLGLGILVVGLCGPNLFGLRIKNPRHEAVPMELESRRGIERLIEVRGAAGVYRLEIMAVIEDRGSWDDPARQKHLRKVMDEIRKWPEVGRIASADMLQRVTGGLVGFGESLADRYLSKDRKIVSMDLYGNDGSDEALGRLIEKLHRRLPAYFAKDKGIRVYVGGKQATFHETKVGILAAIPIMFPVLAVAAFLFMAFFFRSLVIPLKALLLNALSLFSTFGILVLVFQNDTLIQMLGYSGPAPGALSVATPIILFGVVFGVSMDYEVFLMARIQEAYRRRVQGAETPEAIEAAHRDAIHEGLSRTGGIITNAALIMVITFAAFVSGTVLPMKEMGFALALAVALDATLIRMILLPAVLKLLGSRTWYWPFAAGRDGGSPAP